MRQITTQYNTMRQRGDTLVEVMIAIVIVASVIGGAYTVSNRSLQATRGAQERSGALKLGEAQLEQLKNQVTTDSTKIFGATVPTNFCLASDATGTHVYDFTQASQKVNCIVNVDGTPSTAQPNYTINIVRTGNDFKLTETWADISGKFNDSLQLNYRAYQP
ncbi:MAG TPA: prepilin-type N-terminal cleavage/methylation domain-containing protein [Candidatus Saccharimonadales bacterium]|nr:prepilin-type N-terminal cleavage/methylation domain-containing protein [Candidatus Saccharimonadales bacterium]